MKILLISPTQTGIGGIAQHIQNLSKFLKKNGHYVEIISSENTFTIPIKGLKNPSFMLSSYLKSKFKKNFDIIHAHNIPAALPMKNYSGKKILTIHGIFSTQIEQLHGKSYSKISKKFEHRALTWANTITVVSKEAEAYYSNYGLKIIQIPNGIDFSLFELEAERKFKKQIIFAGRLSKEKGIEVLIKICKNLPSEIHMLILGDGPEINSIKKIESQQNNIHYLGIQDHNKTISLIKGSDILLQPSLSEGISSTILEAMACKTPVIASNVGGNKELIQNQKSGILVEPTDYDMYGKKIIELLSDTKLCENLITSALTVARKYDWKIIGEKYLQLYTSIP